MCGRYTLTAGKEELEKRYQAEMSNEDEYEKEAEVFPTTVNWVLLPNDKLYPLKWGFTPSYAKQPIINARSETVLEKPTFKEPFEKKRCIVPATSFFEWQKQEGQEKKIKKEVFVKDLPIFSIAGICERYENEDGESILTYTILTTDANGQMKPIHHRMPVLLHPEQEKEYLDLSESPADVQKLLQPFDGELVIRD